MFKPESNQPNQMLKILLILARRLDLVLFIKEKIICHLVNFAVPVDHKVNMIKSEKINQYGDGDTNSSWHTWNLKAWKNTEIIKDQRKDEDFTDHCKGKIY